MRALIGILFVVGCGANNNPPAAAECDHTQGSDSRCCGVDGDCVGPQTEFCVPPGTPRGCGVCSTDVGDCLSDAECKPQGATRICVEVTCTCERAMHCVGGCTSDASCTEGQTCNTSTGRCAATACTRDANCPAEFRCGATGCVRKTCTSDGDCGGYCVGGSCYPKAGECQGPVA